MNSRDTIIAPATAPGEAGIAIIRISGSDALFISKSYFDPSSSECSFKSHVMYHGYVKDEDRKIIDEVMFVYMTAPRSYTAEDVVEIHCHGSSQVIKKILLVFQSAGLRLAKPGEFTYRAFINGRIDLSQAEAVSRLIKSSNEKSRKLAVSQLKGSLSELGQHFSSEIKNCLVLVEAWIDFPEDDLPEEDLALLKQNIDKCYCRISDLLDSYEFGRIQAEGASIILAGEPNVGKSSLLNALLGEDRAIVTSVPGTTRDFLEEGVYIGDVPVRLIDTAGLRVTEDPIENEGIRRAKEKLKEADLVLLLIDSDSLENLTCSYSYLLCKNLPLFLVFSKIDKVKDSASCSDFSHPVFHVSSKEGTGLSELRKAISLHFTSSTPTDSLLLTERRHYDVFNKTSKHLLSFLNLIGAAPLDVLALELRSALDCLGGIAGNVTVEDILDDIFSGFCIGK